jgi:O-6-methylguanine DNA methyltransferase
LLSILKDSRLSGFERKVYRAVAGIPKGETRSYKWVAVKIGKPNASRAVGNALNRNPYPGIVPCHRVVRSDGSIGGYFKGTSVKHKMLEREGVDLSLAGLL